jgi:hypothetical protein
LAWQERVQRRKRGALDAWEESNMKDAEEDVGFIERWVMR